MSAPAFVQATMPDAMAWQPDEPTEADQRAVLAVLRRSEQPARKETLQALTGLDERAVRAAIESLRRGLWPIISSPGRAGYSLSFSPADLAALEHDLSSRALSLLRTRRAVRRIRQLKAA